MSPRRKRTPERPKELHPQGPSWARLRGVKQTQQEGGCEEAAGTEGGLAGNHVDHGRPTFCTKPGPRGGVRIHPGPQAEGARSPSALYYICIYAYMYIFLFSCLSRIYVCTFGSANCIRTCRRIFVGAASILSMFICSPAQGFMPRSKTSASVPKAIVQRPLFGCLLTQLLVFLGCLSAVGIVTSRTWYLERVVGNPRQERAQ